MPLRRRAHGRPGTAVFPPRWETDHSPVVAATHNARVAIGPRSTAAAWNDQDRKMESNPFTAVFTGPASVSPLGVNGSNKLDVDEDLVSARAYDVTIAWEVGEELTDDYVVKVLESTDALLEGSTLTIEGVQRGSSRFARHITCTLI